MESSAKRMLEKESETAFKLIVVYFGLVFGSLKPSWFIIKIYTSILCLLQPKIKVTTLLKRPGPTHFSPHAFQFMNNAVRHTQTMLLQGALWETSTDTMKWLTLCWKVCDVSGNKLRLERTCMGRSHEARGILNEALWATSSSTHLESLQISWLWLENSVVPGLVIIHHSLNLSSCNMPPSKEIKWPVPPPLFPKLALIQSQKPKVCCCLSCGLEHSVF